MKAAFPDYDYADMVDAQYPLLHEGLGIKHLRLVIGNSMGGNSCRARRSARRKAAVRTDRRILCRQAAFA